MMALFNENEMISKFFLISLKQVKETLLYIVKKTGLNKPVLLNLTIHCVCKYVFNLQYI